MIEQSKNEIFAIGLRNAHAMENQALTILRTQAARLDRYPELGRAVAQHISETERQLDRLERLLDGMNESTSMIKDTAMSVAGFASAIANSLAPDEILKNTFANYAFENYEIAAYKSLVTLAEEAGREDAVNPLQQSLREEVAMAEWLDTNIDDITLRYAELRAAGADAKI